MRRTACVLVVFVFPFMSSAKQTSPKVQFVRGDDKIDVMISGKLFTSYLYSDKLPKPSLVPVRSPSGIEVTRRYPLVELKGGSMDHIHHLGLFFCVDRVNGSNFWNYYKHPEGQQPQIKHVKIREMTPGNGKGLLATTSHWLDKDGRFVLEENRTMTFLAEQNKDEYAIDISIDLTAQKETVVFEDIEEGVLAIRLADCLREKNPDKAPRPGRPVPSESVEGTGIYFSSNGDETAKNIWGKRARWVALQGVRAGKVVGVAILNHPAGINYPTYWHVRNYGLFSANPLGQGDFQRQSKYKKNPILPLRLTLKPGEKAHFRFLVVVYEGAKNKKQIDQRFKRFVD